MTLRYILNFKIAYLIAALFISTSALAVPPNNLIILQPSSSQWLTNNGIIYGYGVDTNSLVTNIRIYTNNSAANNFYMSGIITNPASSNTNYFTNSLFINNFNEGTNTLFYLVSNETEGSWFSNFILIDTNKPSAYTLTLPAHSSIISNTTASFHWTPAVDSVSPGILYFIQIDTNQNFSTPLLTNYTSATNMILNISNYYTTWYWRITAYDDAGHKRISSTNSFYLKDGSPPDTFSIYNTSSNSWYTNDFSIFGLAADTNTFISNIALFTNGTTVNHFYNNSVITNPGKLFTNYFSNFIQTAALNEGTNWFIFKTSNSFTYSLYSNYFLIDNNPPSFFNTSLPKSGTNLFNNNISFHWKPSIDTGSGQIIYLIEITTNQNFNQILHTNWISTTNTSVSVNNYMATWYWRVKAIDQAGHIRIGDTNTFNLIDNSPPDGLAITSPNTNNWLTNNFFIFGYATDSNSYISNIALFTNGYSTAHFFENGLIINPNNLYTNYFSNNLNISSLQQGTNWIFYKASNGNLESWFSNHILIDTIKPAPFSISIPQNNSNYINPLIDFHWQKTSDTTSPSIFYLIQLNTNIKFNNPLVTNLTTQTNTTLLISNYFTNWYWRVIARDAAGNFQISETNSFKLFDNSPPEYFTNISPTNTNWQTNIINLFGYAVDSNTYVRSIHIYTNGTNSEHFFNSAIITNPQNKYTNHFTNSIIASTLNEGSNWIFYLVSNENFGNWFSNYTLVDTQPPTPFFLLTPTNNFILDTLTTNFFWTASSDAGSSSLKYFIELHTNSSFNSPEVENNFTATNGSITLPNLHTEWFWRVYVKEPAHHRRYSDTNKFKLADISPPDAVYFTTPASNFWYTNDFDLHGRAVDLQSFVNFINIYTNGTDSNSFFANGAITNPGVLNNNYFTNRIVINNLSTGTNYLYLNLSNYLNYAGRLFTNLLLIDKLIPASVSNLRPSSTNNWINYLQTNCIWNVSYDRDSGISNYIIQFSTNNFNNIYLTVTNVGYTNTNYFHSSLVANATNKWRLYAIDKAGWKSFVSESGAIQTDTEKPLFTKCVITETNSVSVRILITPYDTLSGLSNFIIYTNSAFCAIANSTNFLLTGLKDNTIFNLSIVIKDKANNTNICGTTVQTLFGPGSLILSQSPATNAIKCNTFSNIVLTMKTNLKSSTIHAGNIYIFYISNSITNIVPAIPIYNNTLKTLTIDPPVSLLLDTVYYGLINQNVETEFGNRLSENYIWSFRTVEPLNNFSYSYPSIGQTNISPSTNFNIYFTNNLLESTINTATFYIFETNNSGITNILPSSISHNLTNIQLNPANPLLQNKQYFLNITPNITTVNGAHFQSNYAWDFYTMQPLTSPVSNYPADAESNISHMVYPEIYFPYEIDQTTIHELTIKMESISIVTNRINVSFNYYSASNLIKVIPGDFLNPETKYRITIGTNLKTIHNTHFTNKFVMEFMTLNAYSGISNRSPSPNATLVPLSTVILVDFDTNIQTNTVDSTTFYVYETFDTDKRIVGTISNELNNTRFRITPDSQLKQNTSYTVRLSSGILTADGTPLNNIYWSFSTALPIEDPILKLPNSNDTQISLRTNVLVRFDTNLNSSSVNSANFYLSTNSQGSTLDVAASVYLIDAYTLQLIPATDLLQDTTYYAVLTKNIKTALGSSFATNYIWPFHTISPISNIISNYPASGTTSIPLNISINAKFPKDIQALTVTKNTYFLTNRFGSNIEGSIIYNNFNRMLTLTPYKKLEHNMSYGAVITKGVKAADGTSLSNTFTWGFKTKNYIFSPKSISPTAGSLSNNLNSIIYCTFSNSLNQDTLIDNNIKIYYTNGNLTNNALKEITYNALSNRIELTPANLLRQNQNCFVVITTNVETLDGVSLNSNFIWSFKTMPAIGGITAKSPQNNGQNIALTTSITANLGRDINMNSVSANSFIIVDSGNSKLSGEYTYNNFNYTIIFNSVKYLSPSTRYTVTITTNIKAADNTSLKSNISWQFTTIGSYSKPTEIYPAAEAEFVNPKDSLYAVFQDPLQPSTINKGSFQVYTTNNELIAGIVSYNDEEKKINFIPSSPLNEKTIYFAEVSKNIISTTGQSLLNDYLWKFRTGNIIGKEGGNLATVDTHFKLIVPQNCFAAETVISIEQKSLPDKSGIVAELTFYENSVYAISPETIQFNKTATAILNLSKTAASGLENVAAYYFIENNWYHIGGTLYNNTISFPVTSPGIYSLFERTDYIKITEADIKVYPRVAEIGAPVSITFPLEKAAVVSISVYTLNGDFITYICEGYSFNTGYNSVEWNLQNYKEENIKPGLYIIFINDETRALQYKKLFYVK